MISTPSLFALAALAVTFAGISKGGFGSGAAFAAAAVLAIVVPPGVALGVMLPLLMLIDVAALRPYWRRWSWPDARLLIAGGVPGTLLGAVVWRIADDDLIRLLIGIIAIAFVAWQMARGRGLIRVSRRAPPRWLAVLAGAGAGLTSFVSHAGGPIAAIYLLAREHDKTTYQATTVLTFWALNVVKMFPYAFLGIFTAETLWTSFYLLPFALLGVWLGVLAHRQVPERVFFGVTYTLLLLTGTRLVWDALS